jgi:hypothetical protein
VVIKLLYTFPIGLLMMHYFTTEARFLIPPKGAKTPQRLALPWELIETMPARNRFVILRARPTSRDHTGPLSPNSLSFAM